MTRRFRGQSPTIPQGSSHKETVSSRDDHADHSFEPLQAPSRTCSSIASISMAIFPHTSESSNVPAVQGVFQVRGDPKIGAPEITPPRGRADPSTPDHDADPLLVESCAQERFDLAVDHCRGVNKGLGYFHKISIISAKPLTLPTIFSARCESIPSWKDSCGI